MPSIPKPYDPAALTADLILDEGKRLTAYHDTRGIVSIGIGRNLVNTGISDAECDLMFRNDVDRALQGLDATLPWWRGCNEIAQRVLINLAFNMGTVKLAQFNTFLALMREARYTEAAADLQQTAWWGEVGGRGPRMAARLAAAAQLEGTSNATS